MGERLLVVDDEPAIGDYIRLVAKPMGFDVEVTTGGREFLEAYERAEPSLICMDIVMPELDGLELLRELGARGCRSPVLLMSAYNRLIINNNKNFGDTFGLPYIRSLGKPFRIKALEEKLQDAGHYARRPEPRA